MTFFSTTTIAALATSAGRGCMKPVPLVDYPSSDEEYDEGKEGKGGVTRSIASYADHAAPPSTVHTSLGITRQQPLQGDWLCYVFIPLSSSTSAGRGDELSRVFRKAVRRLRSDYSTEEPSPVVETANPHISLTRPILLRKHECDRLVHCVRDALQAFQHRAAAAATGAAKTQSRLTLAFSSFSTLSSQDGTRTFWAADVSQGWTELRRLTNCLDVALAKLYARPYFEQARFHASFAHVDSSAKTARKDVTKTTLVEALNSELGARLRACDAVCVDTLGITIGSTTQYVPL